MTIAHSDIASTVGVTEATPAEGRELFERACVRELGVTADAFLNAHDSGDYPADWPPRAVQRVEFLLPFVR